jgi:high-affinity iron transporter
MWSSLALSLREGLEVSLIIGIILAHVTKIGRKDLKYSVFIGAAAGLIFSLVFGFIGFNEARELEEESEEIFEGVMMLLAASLIAYFILWLHRSKEMTSSVTSKISRSSSKWGLIVLAFLSVFREGTELIIFNLTQVNQHASSIVFGSISGILLAIVITYILFKTAIKLNLWIIFKALGVFLIFIGGELCGEGLVKLFEAGGEPLEIIGFSVFTVASLYLFFQTELKKLRVRKQKSAS